MYFFFSSRRRHTRLQGDWSSDVCSSDLRFVEAELSALLQAAGGTLPVIKKDGRGVFVMETTHAPSEKPAAKASAPAEIGRASCRERVKCWRDDDTVEYNRGDKERSKYSQ